MKKKTSLFLLSFCTFLLLQSCGEEIARLPINQISNEANQGAKEVTLELKQGEEIAFWSDMDLEWEGQIALIFHVHITKNGHNYKSLEINPFEKNVTVGEIKTSFGDKTSWSFSGKNSHIKIEEDANYTFRSYLIGSENPSLNLKKAELVLKK